MEQNKIGSAYKSSLNIYDNVLTQNNCLTKLYIKIFWDVNDFYIADKVLNFLGDDFKGKLLDVPVGTAVFTYKKYAKLKTAKITCLDYSNEMLNQAQRRFASVSNNNVTCRRGDVSKLPFEDQAFDIVLSMNGFHAFPDKEKAFCETSRVLKKGGMFIGCFYIKKEKILTDFVVNVILSKKGWFTPPFYTKEELNKVLNTMYSKVELFNEKAMVWFKCIK